MENPKILQTLVDSFNAVLNMFTRVTTSSCEKSVEIVVNLPYQPLWEDAWPFDLPPSECASYVTT